MSKPLEAIESEALNLPQADRSRLIDRLIASLEQDPEWESAWSAEADRREDRIVRGEAAWVSGADAIARIRSKLA
jgi:hypothetical protein